MFIESEITKFIKNITKKNPIIGGSSIFRQTKEEIYYNHFTELIHELCHYVVSSNINHPNLGFEEYYDYNNDNYPKELFIDEMVARYLTSKFILYLDIDKLSNDYGNYFMQICIGEHIINDEYFILKQKELKKLAKEKISNNGLNNIFIELKNLKQKIYDYRRDNIIS